MTKKKGKSKKVTTNLITLDENIRDFVQVHTTFVHFDCHSLVPTIVQQYKEFCVQVKSNEPTPTALDLDEIDQACKEIEEEVKKSGKKTKAKKVESTGDEMKTDTKNMTFQKESAQYVKNDSEIGTIERSQSWISQTVRFVIEHLNKFGACVIDDFLGENKGIKILNEVLNLRSHQTFQVRVYYTITNP